MNAQAVSFARYFITSSSIVVLLAIMMFFAIGTTIGLPMSYDQSFTIVKQVTPVFIGYLGQCAYYIAKGAPASKRNIKAEPALIYMISVSPFAIFLSVFVTITFAFWLSNMSNAAPGTGMSFARFTDWLTILSGLFTATISILTAWLFGDSSGAQK